MHDMAPSFALAIYAPPQGFGLDNFRRWTGMWVKEVRIYSAI